MLSVLLSLCCTFDTAGRSWVKMKRYQESVKEREQRQRQGRQKRRSGSRRRNWRHRYTALCSHDMLFQACAMIKVPNCWRLSAEGAMQLCKISTTYSSVLWIMLYSLVRLKTTASTVWWCVIMVALKAMFAMFVVECLWAQNVLLNFDLCTRKNCSLLLILENAYALPSFTPD